MGNKAAEKPKNLHEGHRERLRIRFLSEGLDGFEDHNVLELLLFYSIPVKDTNELAHRLIKRFGSLSEVFDADPAELCSVAGVGEKTAALIKLMPELFRKYEVDKVKRQKNALTNAEQVAKFVSKYFKGLNNERLYALYLAPGCRPADFRLISEGGLSSTPVKNQLVVKNAYDLGVETIILVHNHPSGSVAPSKSDVNVTMDFANTIASLGLKLKDHIIIGHGDDYFSFRESDKWSFVLK